MDQTETKKRRRESDQDDLGQGEARRTSSPLVEKTKQGRTNSSLLIAKIHDLLNVLESDIKANGDDIPEWIQNSINTDLRTIIASCEKISCENKAGEYLHQLHKNEPDMNKVEETIDAYPDALLYKNKAGYVPIQVAVCEPSGKRYIPLLAIEASKREIGNLQKGGLLLPVLKVSWRRNVLQMLVSDAGYHRPKRSIIQGQDYLGVQVLKHLRYVGLLLDEDIIQFNLIQHASWEGTLNCLNYLISIFPKTLSVAQPYNGNFPIHLSEFHITNRNTRGLTLARKIAFKRLLTAGIKHFPESFGFLFQQNYEGELPINQAISKFGKDETGNIIWDATSSVSHPLPILHHAFQYTPDLREYFMDMYPDAIHLKDGQDRSLLHMVASKGLNISDLLLAASCAEKYLEEKDPVTNLYPFMLAATSEGKNNNEGNLTLTYKLLVRFPEILS